MRQIVAVAIVGLLTAVLQADDGPVAIKVKPPRPGDRIKVSRTENSANTAFFTDMGTEQKKDEAISVRQVYTDEVVTKPDRARRPTKLKRTYELVEVTRNGTKEDLGLAGKTVMIEKDIFGYTMKMDGRELTGAVAELLAKDFGQEKEFGDEDMLPKTSVKPGSTWKVDVAKFAKDLAGELDISAVRSSAVGRLVKTYDKDGRRFGVVEVRMELAVNRIGGAGGQVIDLTRGSKLHVVQGLDMCIDGSRNVVAKTSAVSGEVTGSANGIDLKLKLSSVTEGVGEEMEKK